MRSLSITGHWNVSRPSGASPWNSIFGPKKVRGEIWPKRSEKKQQKNYQDEDKKSTINKN